ncbi:MAG: PAS domain S-box protein, partial [Alphaproteobacteria bacterium]|nr:PAS domain S-box protein [Alphaproteobacteria bacterium]
LEAETARLRELLREAQAPSGPSDAAADPGSATNRPVSSQYKQIAEILDASADAIISVDARGMVNRFNRGAEVVFGYRSSEVIGRPLDILIPDRFRKDHRNHMARFDRASESSRLMNERGEIFGLRKDGTEFPAEASIVKLEAGGRPVFTVIMRDITERTAADAAIRASEELLKSVLDNLPAATHIKGADGRYTMVNREYERQFGIRAADIIGRTAAEVHPPHIAAQVALQDREVLEGPAGAEYEFEIVDNVKDRVILTMKRQLTDGDGKPTAILCAETDITERQKIQSAIREREAQLRQAQNMAQIGTFVWDETADCCEFCSDELATILGSTPEKLIEASKAESWVLGQIYPDDRDRYSETIRDARKTASSYDVEYRFRRDDGELIHLREMGEPERDAEGQVVRTFGTLQDITQIRRAEETLRQNESLLRQAQRLSRMGTYVWDLVTDTCVFCSDELAELFDMSARAFIAERGSGAKYQNFVHPDDQARFAESANRSADDAIPYDIEYRAFDAHGEVRHFREIAENIVNKDGKMTRSFGTLQDVTHLRHAEQALRQSEQQLRQAHRMARVGTFSWDDNAGICLGCSSELADLFGMSVREFMEKRGTDEKYTAYLHPDDLAGFR